MTEYTIEQIEAVEFAHKFLTETLEDWQMAQGRSSIMEVDDGLSAMWVYVENMENFLDIDIQDPLCDETLDFVSTVIRDELNDSELWAWKPDGLDMPDFVAMGYSSADTLEQMISETNDG